MRSLKTVLNDGNSLFFVINGLYFLPWSIIDNFGLNIVGTVGNFHRNNVPFWKRTKTTFKKDLNSCTYSLFNARNISICLEAPSKPWFPKFVLGLDLLHFHTKCNYIRKITFSSVIQITWKIEFLRSRI